MIIHKHLLMKQKHVIEVMRHNFQLLNGKSKSYHANSMHREKFVKETKYFIEELKRIQKHNSLEVNELLKTDSTNI